MAAVVSTVAAASLACPIELGASPALAGPTEDLGPALFNEPDAVVLNVPEQDLNRFLQTALRAKGGPRFEGRQADAGRGLRGVRYQVEVSDPVLKLGDGGRVSLSLDIEKADLEVDRWERKLAGRMAYCENAGLSIDASRPVGIGAELDLEIAGGDLEIVPRQITVGDAENIRLLKPSRCRKVPLPTWLLWRLGQAHLRREIGKLDRTLLAKASRSVERLGTSEGLFRRRWQMRSLFDPESHEDFELSLRYLDTSQGSLLVSLAGSSTKGRGDNAPPPGEAQATFRKAGTGPSARRTSSGSPVPAPRQRRHPSGDEPRPERGSTNEPSRLDDSIRQPAAPPELDRTQLPRDRPSLAISPAFLNAMLASSFTGSTGVTRKARGDFSRLMKSSAVYALIPGLRGVTSRETLSFSFAFPSAPTVEFRALDDTAEIRIRFQGIEMNVWEKTPDGPVRLGAMVVDSGTVGLALVPNTLGGVSFKIVENDWHVSSRGIEFDDVLFEATLQELMFAEAFETLSEPLLREGLSGGGMTLAPRAFRVAGGYLVVELDALPSRSVPAPTAEIAAAGIVAGSRERAGASTAHANK